MKNFIFKARFFLYAGALILCFIVFFSFFKSNADDSTWRLSVASSIQYSETINVQDEEVTVFGSQQNVGEENAIEYTLMKANRFGFKQPYEAFIVKGDQPFFQHTFTNIPNGSDYQIKIYNYSRCFCEGELFYLENGRAPNK